MSYGYDAINRLASIASPTATGPSTDTVSYAYDDSTTTHKQTLTFPGGSSEEISRDASGKITKVLVKDNAGNTLARREYAYAYSPAGGGSAQSELVQTLTRLNGDVTSYGYGSVDQLTSATTTNGASSVGSYGYAYDDALNRTSKTHTDASGTATTTYAYNANNQLCWSTTAATSHTDCNDPPSGATTYGYDANGNQTTGGSGAGKTYDALNRLTGLGSDAMSYLSPDNTELVADGSRTLTNDLLGLSAETDGSTTTAIARDSVSGAPSSLRGGSGKRYFIAHNIGSTIGLLDASSGGAISRSYTYDPDGNATSTGSRPGTDLQFAGGYSAHGVIHFGARFYDSTTARWTQQDPLHLVADLQQANPYSYVAGDPINLVDPTGQLSLSDILRIGKTGIRHFSGVQCGVGVATWSGSSTYDKVGTVAACAAAFAK